MMAFYLYKRHAEYVTTANKYGDKSPKDLAKRFGVKAFRKLYVCQK